MIQKNHPLISKFVFIILSGKFKESVGFNDIIIRAGII